MMAHIMFAARVAILVAALDASTLAGRAIPWVGDYDAALQQARASGAPMLMLFEAPESPVRARAIEGARALDIMRERCVFVRMDPGGEEAIPKWHAEAGSPAVVIAGPDGAVQHAWPDMPPMEELAARLKETWSASALLDADKAAGGGDDAKAIAVYWQVVRVAASEADVERARKGLAGAGRRGHVRIGEVNPLLKARDFLAAARLLEAIERDYAGTETARLAASRRAELMRLPSVVKEMARQEADEKRRLLLEGGEAALAADDFEAARTAFHSLVSDYHGTAEAARAAEHLEKLEKEMAAEADERQKAMDRECRMWMSYADTLAAQKREREAAKYYAKIIEAWPDSAYAEAARTKTSKLEQAPRAPEATDDGSRRP